MSVVCVEFSVLGRWFLWAFGRGCACVCLVFCVAVGCMYFACQFFLTELKIYMCRVVLPASVFVCALCACALESHVGLHVRVSCLCIVFGSGLAKGLGWLYH